MGFPLTAPRSNVPDPPVPRLDRRPMPFVPPLSDVAVGVVRFDWFERLTIWAEREERGVVGVAGRLLMGCAAVLCLLWLSGR